MSFVNPLVPNLADFITFCTNQGIYSTFLPANSNYFVWGLQYAQNIVLSVPQIPAIQYVIAVYNLGLHWLIENAQDQSGLVLNSLTWVGGVVTATVAVAMTIPPGATVDFTVLGATPTGYNGQFKNAFVLSPTTFTYPLVTNPGTETAPGTFNTNFFADARSTFNLMQLVAGPVESSDDQGTGQHLKLPDFFSQLTFSDLDVMKTPWGRNYLAYAQAYGPSIVEFS